MRGLIRTGAAAAVVAALAAFLRELFRERPELLRASTAGAAGESAREDLHSGTSRPKHSGTSRPKGGGAPKVGEEKTQRELYEEAQRLDVEGRSKMNKGQLERAVAKAKGGSG